MRLSTHARSSKVIQRTGQSNITTDQNDSNNKPAPQGINTFIPNNSNPPADPLKTKGTGDKDHHVISSTPPELPSNGEKPLNCKYTNT